MSEAQPCTNVPIFCRLCNTDDASKMQTIWKYNTWYHLITEHADEEGNIPPMPLQMIVDCHISRAEEDAVGIDPDTTDDWRVNHDFANSSDVEGAAEELQNVKRDRSASNVLEGPRTKSRKR